MAESSTNKNKARASKYSSDEEEENRNIDLGLSMKSLSLGPKKKLLIMGIGGFLCHRVCYRYRRETIPKHRHPDASYGSFYGLTILLLIFFSMIYHIIIIIFIFLLIFSSFFFLYKIGIYFLSFYYPILGCICFNKSYFFNQILNI